MTAGLYEAIVGVTENYLGPAGRRFISRQVNFHLGKPPEQINSADMPKLIEWVKTAMALLTEDKNLVDEFESKMEDLTKQYA